MTEQHTIQEAVNLAQQWGPIGSAIFLVVIFIAYQIWSGLTLKKKALDPITKLLLELEKRPTYDWIEKEFVACQQIRAQYMRKDVADAQFNSLTRELDDIKTIVQEINRKIK